jgi:hypothetical protein
MFCLNCEAVGPRISFGQPLSIEERWNTRAILSTGDDAGLARELRDLAIVLHRKHYPEVVQWEPLDDPRGILSQIDNMTAGLVRANLSDAGPVEEWRDKLAELHEWTGREDVGENSELYGFLCSLIGYLVTGEEQAAAILSLTARNKALEELALLVSEESIEAMADDIACAVVEPRADVVAMRRSAMIRLGERLRAPLSTDLKRIAALNHQDNRQNGGGDGG